MATFTAWMWDLPAWACCHCPAAWLYLMHPQSGSGHSFDGAAFHVRYSCPAWGGFGWAHVPGVWEHGICPLAGPYTQLDIVLPRYSLTLCRLLINIPLPVAWNDAQHPHTGRGESERSPVADFLLVHSWQYLPQIRFFCAYSKGANCSWSSPTLENDHLSPPGHVHVHELFWGQTDHIPHVRGICQSSGRWLPHGFEVWKLQGVVRVRGDKVMSGREGELTGLR